MFTVTSEELADFLNPPPSQITVSGQATINPDYQVCTITSNDFFYGDLLIYSPFALAILDTVSIDTDISDSEIDADSRPDEFEDTFKYGTFQASLESHLPLGTAMTIYIGTVGDSTLYTDPNTLVLGPYTVQSAITDSLGHVVQTVVSSIADSLSSSQLTIFDNDSIYISQRIDLLPTDSAGVQVLGDDYLGVNARARMQVMISENLWNEE